MNALAQPMKKSSGSPGKINAKKFALWLFILSIVMLFASMTSAYIVRQAEGSWFVFDIPPIFYWSTAVIALSSVTMQLALISAQKNASGRLQVFTAITFTLGILFLYLQLEGWKVLVSMDVYFSGGNVSGSFIYLLTGLHAVHLISGIMFLFIVFIQVFRQKINAQNPNSIEMCNTYWHFLGGLWVYLLIFLLLNR